MKRISEEDLNKMPENMFKAMKDYDILDTLLHILDTLLHILDILLHILDTLLHILDILLHILPHILLYRIRFLPRILLALPRDRCQK